MEENKQSAADDTPNNQDEAAEIAQINKHI